MAGYPRVIGYHPGVGYVVGHPGYVVGQPLPGLGFTGQQLANAAQLAAAGVNPGQVSQMPVVPIAPPVAHSAPWRPMMAPGNPPIGEGHVPMPLNPETFGGVWGAGGAGAGVQITYSARPQKPFKMTRVLARTTILVNTGGTANGTPIAQIFVGTDLQQAELGYIDLATIGAGGSFDTWVSMKQAEPGVWIRFQVQLTTYPTSPDSLSATLTGIGHYLH